MVCSISPVQDLQLIPVSARIVVLDFEDLRDLTPAFSSFDVQEEMNRVGDAASDRHVGQLDSALKHTARKAGDGLFG